MLDNPLGLAPFVTMPSSRWRLDIDPGQIRSLAACWTRLGRDAGGTQDLIGPGGQQLSQHWTGPAGAAYQAHSAALGTDIKRLATTAADVAGALDQAASAAAMAQDQLAELRSSGARLSSLRPVDESGGQITFYPQDQAGVDQINDLAGQADGVHAAMEQVLRSTAATLNSGLLPMAEIGRSWGPQVHSGLDLGLGSVNLAKGGKKGKGKGKKKGNGEDEDYGGWLLPPPKKPPPGWLPPEMGPTPEERRRGRGTGENLMTVPLLPFGPGAIIGPHLDTAGSPDDRVPLPGGKGWVSGLPPGTEVRPHNAPGDSPYWPMTEEEYEQSLRERREGPQDAPKDPPEPPPED